MIGSAQPCIEYIYIYIYSIFHHVSVRNQFLPVSTLESIREPRRFYVSIHLGAFRRFVGRHGFIHVYYVTRPELPVLQAFAIT